jgi:hypothetical protein
VRTVERVTTVSLATVDLIGNLPPKIDFVGFGGKKVFEAMS